MKRKIITFNIIIVIFAVCLLGFTYFNQQNKDIREQNEMKITQNKDIKKLVVYFSATHTTKKVAKYISKQMNCDIYEIKPEQPYINEDLDYGNNQSRTSLEQNDSQSRPPIKNKIDNIEEYDVIFLGYPIWHGQAPRIISTFLESYDFSYKTIVPFCTSHSSEIGNSDKNLHLLVDSSVVWMDGHRFSGDESQTEITKWISCLQFNQKSKVSSFDLKKGENKIAPTVILNSGYQMPIVGLGTYSLLNEECMKSVQVAIKQGYRLIDTAFIYDNEESIGKAIQQSGVPREDIFITTKLYINQYKNASEAIEEALRKLDVDYIDLMLLHHPGEYDVEAYKVMEQAVNKGKIRSIGLSNWYIKELEEFLPQISITPAVIQNEIHPYYQENAVIDYVHEKGIVMEGWYPLGGRGHTKEMLSDKVLVNIAKKHNKSVAQIILRWNLQKGVIVIPGSSNPNHILENISIFDFELTSQEMKQINELDRNEKHDWY